jgi:type II secretory pathway component GspD/PulD (secretin)
VPVLSNIPLLGELFKNRNNDKASREVAVFVTAHLVRESTQMASAPAGLVGPAEVPTTGGPASPDDFRKQLAESMRQNR